MARQRDRTVCIALTCGCHHSLEGFLQGLRACCCHGWPGGASLFFGPQGSSNGAESDTREIGLGSSDLRYSDALLKAHACVTRIMPAHGRALTRSPPRQLEVAPSNGLQHLRVPLAPLGVTASVRGQVRLLALALPVAHWQARSVRPGQLARKPCRAPASQAAAAPCSCLRREGRRAAAKLSAESVATAAAAALGDARVRVLVVVVVGTDSESQLDLQ